MRWDMCKTVCLAFLYNRICWERCLSVFPQNPKHQLLTGTFKISTRKKQFQIPTINWRTPSDFLRLFRQFSVVGNFHDSLMKVFACISSEMVVKTPTIFWEVLEGMTDNTSPLGKLWFLRKLRQTFLINCRGIQLVGYSDEVFQWSTDKTKWFCQKVPRKYR